jgi:hypothetical protein
LKAGEKHFRSAQRLAFDDLMGRIPRHAARRAARHLKSGLSSPMRAGPHGKLKAGVGLLAFEHPAANAARDGSAVLFGKLRHGAADPYRCPCQQPIPVPDPAQHPVHFSAFSKS